MFPPEYARALLDRCVFVMRSDTRKRRAWDRWLIYTEQHTSLILDRITSTQNDDGVRNEIAKFVDLTVNPGLDVTRQTSVCWRQGARRSIEGVDDDAQKAFHELVLESRIDVVAPSWNRIGALVGALLVVPAVRKQRLAWDTLLPTFTEVEPDPDDYYGTPLAAAWTLRSECEQPEDAVAVYLDDQAWRTYRLADAPVPAGLYGAAKPQEFIEALPPVEHGLGYFPGVPLRFAEVFDGDWYGSPYLNQRLVDATVSIGVLNAALGFTRKAQNKRLLTLIGDLGGFPDGQSLDPEVPFVADVPAGAGVPPTIQAIDFDTNPDNFIKHASWIYRNIASAYGGQVESDDTGAGTRLVFSPETLTEIRNEQIPHAREFERMLWATAVDMCRAMNHPLADRLPTRDEVLAGFRIDFGKLSRKFSDPSAEQAWVDWLLSKGATDQLEILRAQGNTTLDDEQLQELIEKRLEVQAWFNDVVTTRNLSMTPGGVATAAQAFGATGTAVRDGTPVTVAARVPVEGAAPDASNVDASQPDGADPAMHDAPPADAPPSSDAPPADVQASALNGAQITSFMQLAAAFAGGTLPLELGERFLPIAFPGSVKDEAAARRLLEPLRGFKVPSQPNPNAGADAPAAKADANNVGSDRNPGARNPGDRNPQGG
ncbi:MAG: hypothetical protein IPH07_23640 [Deltaproteobacteria bacterium]|nr:hypothetical protein [Deltaproteobacteria bacterium]MBK8720674.1 hypothetical protein [Deltaproteobacteria bacterium]